MWVPKGLVELFTIGKETVSNLREELVSVKTERDGLKDQLRIALINGDWFRMQVNTLQLERTALMEKAYGIKLPAPEIVRQPVATADTDVKEFSFEDMGDRLARQFGLPLHDTKQ